MKTLFLGHPILVIVALVVLLAAAFFVGRGQCIVISKQERPTRTYNYHVGEIVNPLQQFDFHSGKWAAFLVLSNEDRRNLPEPIPNATVLKCTDIGVLAKLRDTVAFTFRNADTATVTSQILLFKDDVLVFESGIVVENASEGLQSRDFGWLEVKELGSLTGVFRDFRRVWSPVVLL